MKNLLRASLSLLPAILLATVALSASPAIAADAYVPQKVVYHLNSKDPGTYMPLLRNVQNHINAVGQDKLDLRVVMHGNGIGMLLDAVDDVNLQSRIIGLKARGIGFKVCANTLTGRELDYEIDLFDVRSEDIVPSGVAEIAALQAQGFTYLKP